MMKTKLFKDSCRMDMSNETYTWTYVDEKINEFFQKNEGNIELLDIKYAVVHDGEGISKNHALLIFKVLYD